MDTNGNLRALLLKDLCGRLPYGVKIRLGDYDYQVCGYNSEKEIPVKIWYYYDSDLTLKSYIDVYVTDYRPYLRPMSSMTEEEIHEFQEILGPDIEVGYGFVDILDSSIHTFSFLELQALFDWLNAHHFDYRGLIPKGLAIEATEGVYKC